MGLGHGGVPFDLMQQEVHLPTWHACQDRIGTGPPRARTEVIYVDLGYWAISGNEFISVQNASGASQLNHKLGDLMVDRMVKLNHTLGRAGELGSFYCL